jgi:hypothetical protein
LIVPEASLVVAATQSSGMVCSAFDKIPLGAEPKLLVPSRRTAILFPTFMSAHADLIFGDVFPTVGDILEGHLRVRRATRSAFAS